MYTDSNTQINLDNGVYIIISGDAPYHDASIVGTHILAKFASTLGNDTIVENVTGKYNTDDSIENAIIVSFPSERQAIFWGTIMSNVFGQDSFVLSVNGKNTLYFPRDTRQNVTGTGVTWHTVEPECFYSTRENGDHFTLNLDF